VANEAVALIALAVLVSLNQWMFTLTVARVDPRLIPVAARRRVHWLVAHTARIHVASAGLVAAGLVLQVTALLR
jgi:hypothetical protein